MTDHTPPMYEVHLNGTKVYHSATLFMAKRSYLFYAHEAREKDVTHVVELYCDEERLFVYCPTIHGEKVVGEQE